SSSSTTRRSLGRSPRAGLRSGPTTGSSPASSTAEWSTTCAASRPTWRSASRSRTGVTGTHGSRWLVAIPAEGRLTLELRVIERVNEVSAADWDALVREDASPFVEHAWLDCLEEAGCVGGRTGWLPRHLVLYEGSRLVAAAPAYLKTNSE